MKISAHIINYCFNNKKKHRSNWGQGNPIEKHSTWKCLNGENKILHRTFECDERASLGN